MSVNDLKCCGNCRNRVREKQDTESLEMCICSDKYIPSYFKCVYWQYDNKHEYDRKLKSEVKE